MKPAVLVSLVLGALYIIKLSSAFNSPLSAGINLNLHRRSCTTHLNARARSRVTKFSCLLDAADLPRKRKEMPQYVQDILSKESLAENPFNSTQLIEGMMKTSTGSKRRKQNVVSTEIYVRGLPWNMDRKALRVLFSNYSSIYARISTHPGNSSRSLGYGFVGFKTVSKANAAIRAFNGTEVEHQGKKTTIHATFATAKPNRRELASKSSQREFKDMVSARKMQLTARDSGKVVMSADDMPRRWKVMSDKVRHAPALARRDCLLSRRTRVLASVRHTAQRVSGRTRGSRGSSMPHLALARARAPAAYARRPARGRPR